MADSRKTPLNADSRTVLADNHISARWSVLFVCAAIILPYIFLFYLFNINKTQNILYLGHFMIVGLVFAAVSMLLFFLFQKIVSGREGALIMLLIWWGWFFMFGAMYDFFMERLSWFRGRYLILAIILVLFILALILRYFSTAIKKNSATFLVFPIVLCCFFIINFIPALYSEVLMGMLKPKNTEMPFKVKSDFVIDKTLANPDIYWIHMDGMMGFSAVEKYYGDSQETLKDELHKRGFILNEAAALHAGDTMRALPCLLSPTLYDDYLGDFLSQIEHLPRHERLKLLEEKSKIDGVDYVNDIAMCLETFYAFLAKGYRQVMFNRWPDEYLPLMDLYYVLDDSSAYGDKPFLTKEAEARRETYVKAGSFHELLVATTPLFFIGSQTAAWLYPTQIGQEIPYYDDEVNLQLEKTMMGIDDNSDVYREDKAIFRMLLDSFSIASPKLVYIVNSIAHKPYDKLYSTGKYENPSPDDPWNTDLLYLPNHEYAAEVMLLSIDMILEQNPAAVIILQGDHGIHVEQMHDYMSRAGYTDEEIIEMNFSTISAVRVPEQYGSLSEPMAPLNLSRFLVNSFVGENYRMRSE